MYNRDIYETDAHEGVVVVKDLLVGREKPEIPTGKCRLLFVGEEGQVTVICPYLDDSTDRNENPSKIRFDVMSKYCIDKGGGKKPSLVSMKYLNGGAQIVFTVAGPLIAEVVEKRVETPPKTRKSGNTRTAVPVVEPQVVLTKVVSGHHPFHCFTVGEQEFKVYVIHMHRYDRKASETHVEIICQGQSLFFKRPDEGVKLLPWVEGVFRDLFSKSPNDAHRLKTLLHKEITGYASRNLIGDRQGATLEKFDSLAKHIQKGVNAFGENSLGVLWGVVGFGQEFWNDNTWENDFFVPQDRMEKGRQKMDRTVRFVVENSGLQHYAPT